MMTEAMIKNMKILENNTECQQQLAEAATPEEACDILNRHGLEISVQEVRELIREETELNVEDLDTVAGGCRGIRHVTGYKIVWMPVSFFGTIIYGPVLVPVFCNKKK